MVTIPTNNYLSLGKLALDKAVIVVKKFKPTILEKNIYWDLVIKDGARLRMIELQYCLLNTILSICWKNT